jgi:hypothetical protein
LAEWPAHPFRFFVSQAIVYEHANRSNAGLIGGFCKAGFLGAWRRDRTAKAVVTIAAACALEEEVSPRWGSAYPSRKTRCFIAGGLSASFSLNGPSYYWH